MPRVNPYEWRSAEWPDLVGATVGALRGGGAEVRVSNGVSFMGMTLTAQQALEMGQALIEFSAAPASPRSGDGDL